MMTMISRVKVFLVLTLGSIFVADVSLLKPRHGYFQDFHPSKIHHIGIEHKKSSDLSIVVVFSVAIVSVIGIISIVSVGLLLPTLFVFINITILMIVLIINPSVFNVPHQKNPLLVLILKTLHGRPHRIFPKDINRPRRCRPFGQDRQSTSQNVFTFTNEQLNRFLCSSGLEDVEKNFEPVSSALIKIIQQLLRRNQQISEKNRRKQRPKENSKAKKRQKNKSNQDQRQKNKSNPDKDKKNNSNPDKGKKNKSNSGRGQKNKSDPDKGKKNKSNSGIGQKNKAKPDKKDKNNSNADKGKENKSNPEKGQKNKEEKEKILGKRLKNKSNLEKGIIKIYL